MITTFRLFDLPENAQLPVLRSMEVVYLSRLSFCSVKAKRIIKSLSLTASVRPCFNGIYVSILLESLNFSIDYEFDTDRIIESLEGKRSIDPDDLCNFRPYSILIFTNGTNEQDLATWVPHKPILYKKLVDHFLEIFHQREISLYSSHPFFTEDAIIRTLGLYNLRHLEFWSSESFEELIKRLPPPKQLDLFGSRELDEQYWKPEVYLQNFDSFSARELVELSFDDMLSMNTKIMEVGSDDINEKHLNRFIKLWIKGTLSRLEYIHLKWQNQGARVFDKVEVLKGIKNSENPEDEERIFRSSSETRNLAWKFVREDENFTEICKGGFDIRGRNGRKATIVLASDNEIFKMFVWP